MSCPEVRVSNNNNKFKDLIVRIAQPSVFAGWGETKRAFASFYNHLLCHRRCCRFCEIHLSFIGMLEANDLLKSTVDRGVNHVNEKVGTMKPFNAGRCSGIIGTVLLGP